jgi:ParB family chromosome partitioning protein
MNQKRPTLGRGLADLLGQARFAERPGATPGAAPGAAGGATAGVAGGATAGVAGAPAGAAADMTGAPAGAAADGELAHLPLDLLQRGRYQPRADMHVESLAELAESIRAQGVVQPIVVRPLGDPDERGVQRYEIIAGERRWRAAQQAGLAQIPAVIRRIPDEAAIAMALIENIQREDLNPLEEARALERLISEFGLTHQQAAQAVGRSRAAVSNLLRLLELPTEICEQLSRREIEMGHARALLGLPQRRQQTEVAALVVRKGLSVRETESLVRRMIEPRKPPQDQAPSKIDPNIQQLEDELAEKLGAQVRIEHASAGQGRVVIRYHNLEELDGILARIR